MRENDAAASGPRRPRDFGPAARPDERRSLGGGGRRMEEAAMAIAWARRRSLGGGGGGGGRGIGEAAMAIRGMGKVAMAIAGVMMGCKGQRGALAVQRRFVLRRTCMLTCCAKDSVLTTGARVAQARTCALRVEEHGRGADPAVSSCPSSVRAAPAHPELIQSS